MYNSPLPATSIMTGTGAGALAFSGSDSVWLALAAFALVAAGTAILRIVPKRGL